jgi:hypothetical protein
MTRARLCRSLENDTEPRFVNVAEWTSGTNLENATANPEWVSSVRRPLGDPNSTSPRDPVCIRSPSMSAPVMTRDEGHDEPPRGEWIPRLRERGWPMPLGTAEVRGEPVSEGV